MVLKNKLFGLAFGAAVIANASLAYAADTRDVVRSQSNHVVVNTFNNCVRTKWSNDHDKCGGAIAAGPAVVEVATHVESSATEERTIYFDFNKAVITPESQKKLNTLAENLTADSQLVEAKIFGYADRIGSETYNDKLSQHRANNVKDYLSRHGFVNSRVTETRWLGETAPVTHCANDLKRKALISCLSKDRRVEVELEYKNAR